MTDRIPASLLTAVTDFLRGHPPFDGMEPDALKFLAGRLQLSYHPRDSVVQSPDQGEAETLFIVQRGIVRVRNADAHQPAAGAWIALRAGESFSVGALLERRPVANPYIAAEDTFCYQLARRDFDELVGRSPRFHAFCTRYLTSLLQQSRRLLRMQCSSDVGEQQTINASLRSLIKRAPVSCAADTSVGAALATMKAQKIGSIVIVSAAQQPAGIFTRGDVLDRVALAQLDLNAPIGSVMTPNPVALPAEASGYDAAFAMARNDCRHVLVVEEGRLLGIVTERDLFSLQRVSIRLINRTLAGAADAGALQQAARDIRSLAANMLGQGIAAEQVTSLVTALNDALTRRILEIEMLRHDLEGITWCWLAFGSEGRCEQTLSTDQDNGLLFTSAGGTDAESVRGKLLPFARNVNRALDECGFPLCKGNIMAGNPELCLDLAEWQQKFGDWVRNPAPQALLNASIFFDFRAVSGAAQLAETLRDGLLALTRGHAGFLRMMAQNALLVQPPLGMLRDFVVDDDGAYAGSIDLKTAGARLFVDAARIFALAHGVVGTNTAQRLHYAGTRMNLSADEISSAVEGFNFIQQQRLRQQVASPQGAGGANRVDPDTLNEVDRRILKEALRQARKLQSRLALDYHL
ncbi:MAG: DUF294 nucleotidyltransferase-like domain-containing protein [Betaproteobacteria bacterium]|nr:DUF294 nucleotidyltransferase-like domain-containing protein [Betaproteobacteria bacterium]